jgi:hypothetical protein
MTTAYRINVAPSASVAWVERSETRGGLRCLRWVSLRSTDPTNLPARYNHFFHLKNIYGTTAAVSIMPSAMV